jgi:BirA family biotin operon repressor/biotin-[acetyl-CoA-carboxylase] ligase
MLPQQPFDTCVLSGYEALLFDQVTSTNEVAKTIAENSQKKNLVIIARTQTRGHGRRGRQWVSPKGGIWLSLLLRPTMAKKGLTRLTLITASAVASAIEQTLGLRTEVKWPNDLLIGGKKMCGVLVETSIKADVARYVIIGIGINTNVDIRFFPTCLRESITTLKHELGREIDNRTLILNVLSGFEERYEHLRLGRWEDLRLEWMSRAEFLGKQVRVTSFADIVTGAALDIDDSGALLIRMENGSVRKLVAGDLRLR